MRVAIDARPLSHPRTGIGRYTDEIVGRLSNTNNRLFLYSNQPINITKPNVTQRLMRTRLPGLEAFHAQVIFSHWAQKDRVDVFWSPRHHLPCRLKVPSVVTIHDMVWHKHPELMRPSRRLVEQVLMPQAIQKASAVVTVSNSTKRDLENYFPNVADKLHVIYPASFQPTHATESRENYILFVGTLEPRKNLERLLMAFRNLLNSGITSHKLIIAGNEGWSFDLKKSLTRLNLINNVQHLQPSELELKLLYSNCDFLALPSIYEGFGLPIIEAMSFGKPILTSNVSSMPEVAGSGGLLVNPLAVDEIEQGLRDLITDKDLHARLSKQAIIQASRFSWNQTTKQTLAVIESVGSSKIG